MSPALFSLQSLFFESSSRPTNTRVPVRCPAPAHRPAALAASAQHPRRTLRHRRPFPLACLAATSLALAAARDTSAALCRISRPRAAHESLSTGFASAPPSSPPGQSLTRTRAEPRADAAIAVPRLSSPLARHLRRAFAADSALPPLAPAAAEDDLEPQCGNADSHAPCSARPRPRAARDGLLLPCVPRRAYVGRSSGTSSPTRTQPAQATTRNKAARSTGCARRRSIGFRGGARERRRETRRRRTTQQRLSLLPPPLLSPPQRMHAPSPLRSSAAALYLGTSPALRTQLAQAATTAETSRDRGDAPVAAAIPRRDGETGDERRETRRRRATLQPATVPAASVPAAARARPLPAALQRRRLSVITSSPRRESRAQRTASRTASSPCSHRRRASPVPPAASALAAAYARRVPAALQRRRLSLKRVAQSRTASNRKSAPPPPPPRTHPSRTRPAHGARNAPRRRCARTAPRRRFRPVQRPPRCARDSRSGQRRTASTTVASPRLARPVAPPPRMPRAARDVPSANRGSVCARGSG
ncbi:hypothetical protein B0H15DRAFT_998354 [Mycena belliarum]|uniref:Uncharacterized protein n=1 Tax=Mycena belliarum TaxID=1033014 RepID=A0AAD6TW36_9AGAR|nr:hypothetical protein B0H15DRAFT_998354 [Mycena belliae]